MTERSEKTTKLVHEALIETLVADLRPVRRVPRPLVMTAVFLACAVIVGCAVTMSFQSGARPALSSSRLLEWLFVAPALTAMTAALAAFELSHPDRPRAWMLAPAPALALWVGLVGWEIATGANDQSWGDTFAEALECFLCIALSAVPLGALIVLLLRRAHPLQPGIATLLAGVSCAATGAAILAFVHPHSSTMLDHVMHAAAIATVIGLSWLIGRRVVR